MDTGAGRTVSPWMETKTARPTSLAREAAADVVVVGAGVAGVTTAYLLAAEGKSVIVLDDGPIGGGETSRTTAHLTTVLDDRWFEIERLHGEDGARLAAASHAAAIDRVEAVAARERIDCGFERVDGWLFAPPGDASDVIDKELEAARRLAVADVERAAKAPVPAIDTGPALRFPRQAQIHPTRWLAGLAGAATRSGARFHRAHVAEVTGGAEAGVTTDAGVRVKADAVVVATNTPVNDMFKIHTKQAPYRSYAVAMEVPRASGPSALLWDTGDPYHYVRFARDTDESDLMIVGGEDHRTGLADDAEWRFARLVEWARVRFPAGAVRFRWSGQVMEPVDALAFIGRNSAEADHVFVATGFSGNGMTYGTIAGMLLTDLVVGRANPWRELYDPARKSAKALPRWLKENLAGLPGYADWATSGDVEDVADVQPGCAALLRRGGHKVAAFRDEDGRLHEVSATCTHLGAVVRWNSAERTWDCPAHGSRFDQEGRVVCGPANFDLAVVARPPEPPKEFVDEKPARRRASPKKSARRATPPRRKRPTKR